MGKLILFALFTSPVWAVMLFALVTSHRRGPRLDLREARELQAAEAACAACARAPECLAPAAREGHVLAHATS
jgi:hypothetical protein